MAGSRATERAAPAASPPPLPAGARLDEAAASPRDTSPWLALLAVPPKPTRLSARVWRSLRRFWIWQTSTVAAYMLDGWEVVIMALSLLLLVAGVCYGLSRAVSSVVEAFSSSQVVPPFGEGQSYREL